MPLQKKTKDDGNWLGRGRRLGEKGKSISGSAPVWCPLFVTPEKWQIMAMDSLEADPTIARTLFHGLAFSKDITLPEMLKSTIDDHYFYSGRVSFLFESILFVLFLKFYSSVCYVSNVEKCRPYNL